MDPARKDRLLRDLRSKGMAVNAKLVEVLGGKNVDLATLKLPHEEKPGLKPEQKLRRFLDQIIRAQKRLETPDYGRCVQCGTVLPDGALDDTPWLELCARCAA